MLRLTIALLFGGVLAAPAFAQQIVKCTDANGRIEYRNSACPSGTRRDAVEMSNLSIIEAERRGTADRRIDDARSTRAPATAQSPSTPLLAPGSERNSSNAIPAETASGRQR